MTLYTLAYSPVHFSQTFNDDGPELLMRDWSIEAKYRYGPFCGVQAAARGAFQLPPAHI